MDTTGTPKLIPERASKESRTLGQTLSAVAVAARTAEGAVGRALAPLAARWKAEDDRRKAARTEASRDAMRETNRVYLSAMRDVRRDARAFEKARDEVKWWNVFNNERRAARSVMHDSKSIAREAKAERNAARNAYPMSLPGLAMRCHSLHAVPATVWALASDSVAAGATFGASVLAVATNVAVVRLGLRHVRNTRDEPSNVQVDALQPSQYEDGLLQRLDPKAWQAVAAPRGLADVLTAGATLTESGIQVKLTLCNTMDVATLQRKIPQLRAALRLKEDTRLEIRDGKTGGHARLTLRTRSASADIDMAGWWPGAPWAVNTVTGDVVKVPLGKRMMIAGTSGSGKSWSARPLMAEASEYEDHRLIIFDRKHIEGRNWEHRARIVTELDEMDAVCDELIAEGEDRLKTIPRGQDVVEISSYRPRITVFVDEGGELLSDCKKDYADIIDRLRTVARKYRAAEIILVWATQKPSLTGEGHGIDSQIAGQMTDRLALAVATATESRVVFGDDSTERGWKANELPMPGFALYRQQELGAKSIPQMLRMRAMSPQQVIDLPSRPVWSRTVSSTGATVVDLEVRKALEGQGDPWQDLTTEDTVISMKKPRVSGADRDEQILAELLADPCRSLSSLAKAIGASKSVVTTRLGQMEADGIVRKDENDCWHPVD